jgi:CRP-like cAMP-binding protein
MDSIKRYLTQKLEITTQEWSIFSSLITKKELNKSTIFLSKNEIEKHLSFVEVGTIRFYVPYEETDLTFAFIFENDFVCAYDSFLTQKPCMYNAETLTKTTLWQLSYDNLKKLYTQLPKSNVFGRLLTEEIYLKKAQRELSLLTKSPEERYLELFNSRPQLIKTIPLKYIATYIGITPQALSRIRKRIS